MQGQLCIRDPYLPVNIDLHVKVYIQNSPKSLRGCWLVSQYSKDYCTLFRGDAYA